MSGYTKFVTGILSNTTWHVIVYHLLPSSTLYHTLLALTNTSQFTSFFCISSYSPCIISNFFLRGDRGGNWRKGNSFPLFCHCISLPLFVRVASVLNIHRIKFQRKLLYFQFANIIERIGQRSETKCIYVQRDRLLHFMPYSTVTVPRPDC